MGLALTAALAMALTLSTVTGCASDSGSKDWNQDQARPDAPPPALNMSAAPTLSGQTLIAGDSVTITVHTDIDTIPTNVFVLLADSLNASFLIGSASVYPWLELSSSDGRAWNGTSEVSELAASDTHTLIIGLYDSVLERFAEFVVNSEQSTTFYTRIDFDSELNVTSEVTGFPIVTANVTALESTTIYNIGAFTPYATITDWPDLILEVYPATATARAIPEVYADDDSTPTPNPRAKLALASGASYYIRMRGYGSTFGYYCLSVWTTAYASGCNFSASNAVDIYESDGKYTNANPIGAPESQVRTIYPVGDEDWVIITVP